MPGFLLPYPCGVSRYHGRGYSHLTKVSLDILPEIQKKSIILLEGFLLSYKAS